MIVIVECDVRLRACWVAGVCCSHVMIFDTSCGIANSETDVSQVLKHMFSTDLGDLLMFSLIVRSYRNHTDNVRSVFYV